MLWVYSLTLSVALVLGVMGLTHLNYGRLQKLRQTRTTDDDDATFSRLLVDEEIVHVVQHHCRNLLGDPDFHVLASDKLTSMYLFDYDAVDALCENVLEHFLQKVGNPAPRQAAEDLCEDHGYLDTVGDVASYVSAVLESHHGTQGDGY